ncbi:hypothetical protein JFL43_16825 [Viridibacillus sp. YIM B01967]|uniref:Uncharacterized protein n=1 Tax=Viridibacillus soli TaxID=2798301 RepID=A0ABS1HB19_9BACL|nr:hypothetical protein [Viridibacillus soli]MBK3496491.1 hypothetical protein [Viridibacillus soli]
MNTRFAKYSDQNSDNPTSFCRIIAVIYHKTVKATVIEKTAFRKKPI